MNMNVKQSVHSVAFPLGQDFLVPPDKGAEFLSLSWDKGTMGRSQNLAMEQTFFWQSGSDFVPGQSPGIFAPVLVPGQRDIRTRKYLCPGMSHPGMS